MSISTSELKNQVMTFLAKVDAPLLTVTIVEHKKSQFGHYQTLVDQVKNEYMDAWVIFTDDDDLWHPKRSSTYANGIAHIPKAELSVASHLVSKCAYTDDICKHYSEVASFKELDNLPENTYTNSESNYVQFCIRLADLCLFFNVLTPDIRDYLGCDLLIQRFITQTLWRKSMELKTPVPLYFYRDSSLYSHNRPVGTGNLRTAIYVNGCLQQARAGAKLNGTVAKVTQTLQNKCLPDTPMEKIRIIVEEFWDSPLWHALRNFPQWDEVSGPRPY